MKSFLIIAFVALVVIIAFGGGGQRALDPEVQAAVSRLDKSQIDKSLADGVVEVMATSTRHSEASIRHLLGPVKNKPGFYAMTLSGIHRTSAMAMGTDRRHHVVNSYLEGYMPFPTQELWQPLHIISRRKEYQYDKHNYRGLEDIWQTSRQAFYYTRGDCEDHAIILADWLIGMGEDARVAVGMHKTEGHAWVVLIKDGSEFILEATSKSGLYKLKRYPLASLQTDYHPAYMFDRERFWANIGSHLTTRYQGKKWALRSRYIRPSES